MPGNLHWFQYWPLDHLQMFSNWSPGFVTGIATLSWIVLLVLLIGIQLVSSSTRVTSDKSQSWYLPQPESHQLSLQNLSE